MVVGFFFFLRINQYGLTEGLTKLSRINNETADGDKDTLLIYKRESSYDYDWTNFDAVCFVLQKMKFRTLARRVA